MALVRYPAVGAPAKPRVSVCIANYNGVALLPDCIDSILAQDATFEVEILVHDDGSADASVILLRERYPQVELLASEENVGFCVSNNRMVDVARSEFVLLLNNDAALMPGALAELMGEAAARPAATILSLPQFDWDSGVLVDRGCLVDPFFNPIPNLSRGHASVAYVIGACLWLPRSLWRELDGFPAWMGSIGEDLFLCSLARLRGFEVMVAEGGGYRHRQGASFGGNKAEGAVLSTTVRRRHLSERNRLATLFVLTPAPAMWPLLTMFLCATVIEGTLLTVLLRDRSIWREVYAATLRWFLRELPRLRLRRAAEQQARRVGVAAFLRTMRPFPRKLVLLFHYGLPRFRR